MRILHAAVAALSLVGTSAYAACPINCVLLNTEHKPVSVIPAERGALNVYGDGFTNSVNRLTLGGNGFGQISLGFSVNIGGASFNSLFVSENGAVSFGAPILANVQRLGAAVTIGGSFVPARDSLSELRVPVIAPFYADLAEGTDFGSDTGPHLGEIFYQYGVADPTSDAAGRYSYADAVNAVRITWYGLDVLGGSGGATPALHGEPANATAERAFAQLLITDEGGGDFNFEFRTGDPSAPDANGNFSQPGYGSLAGFALPGGSLDFRGPYQNGTPSYFPFRNGALVTDVPESATWLMMILGFGVVGGALRRRRVVEPARTGLAPAG